MKKVTKENFRRGNRAEPRLARRVLVSLFATTVLCLIFPLPMVAATTFEISSDHADCIYERGEPVVFTVAVKDSDGELITEGSVSYRTHATLASPPAYSTRDLSLGNPFTVTATLAKPGFLKLDVKATDNSSASWGVAVAPEQVQPTVTRPADFDTYWNGEIARLDSEVPDLDVQMELVAGKSTGDYNYYNVSFATFNGGRVYGFYTEPKDTSRTYPAIVVCPGAGPYHTSSWHGSGSCVSLMLNVLPINPFTDNATFEANYNTWAANLVSTYDLQSGAAYGAAGISASREAYVFHDIVLGMNRAVNWLAQRTSVDTTRIGYFGGSQGGAFGLMLMGLNTHFTRGAVYIPTLCDNLCVTANPALAPGWPQILWKQPSSGYAMARANIPYFDGVNFASRITCPVRMAVGLIDTTCPPRGGWCAFNALASSDKAMESVPGMTHSCDSAVENGLRTWVLGTSAANTSGDTPAEESSLPIYAVSAAISTGVNLLSMSDQYRTDAIKWTKNVVLSGPVTHAPATIDHPFTITGSTQGTFYHDTGLDTIPLRIALSSASTKITHMMHGNDGGGGVYTNAPGVANLEIQRGNFETTTYYQWGDENGPHEFTLTNNCTISPWSMYLGRGSYAAIFNMRGCPTVSPAGVNMNTANSTTPSVINVENAQLNLHGNWGATGAFQFTNSRGADDPAVAGDCNVVVLGANSQVRAKAFYHKGGSRGRFVFRGGQLQHLWSVPGQNNSSANKNFFLENIDNGSVVFDADTTPIAIDTMANTIEFFNVYQGRLQATTVFCGSHGFEKRGTGKLTLNNPGNKVEATMTGGVSVAAGTLALGADSFFDSSNALAVNSGATFDLNGYNAAFASVSGLGSIAASAAGGALTVGGDDSDSTFSGVFERGAKVVKTGSGTLAMSNPEHEGDLIVSEGTVSLAGANPRGYRHYRFKVDKLYGKSPAGMQFSELKLLDGEADVTKSSAYSGYSFVTNTSYYYDYEAPDKVLDGRYTSGKWLDKRGTSTNIGAYGDQLYIQLDYATPLYITGYAWATANDGGPSSDGRDPSSWRLLASDDGEMWVELDKRENMGPYSTRNEWVGEFSVTYPEERSVRRLGNVVVEEGATLDVRGGHFVCSSLVNHGGTILTDSDDALTLHAEAGEDIVAKSDGSSYVGNVAKDGAGTNTVVGTWVVDGNVSVEEGTMRCLADGFGGKYFRLTITANKFNNVSYMQFAEFYLYGKDGSILSDGRPYSRAAVGTDPRDLGQRQVSLKEECQIASTWENIETAFDNVVFNDGGGCSKFLVLQKPSLESPIVIHFRVRDSTPRVYGYNFVAGNDGSGGRNPSRWTFEGSYDGVTWVLLDAQTYPATSNSNSTASNTVFLNPTFWETAPVGDAAEDDAFPFGESAVVSVASGATLDFYASNMAIAALAVDGDAGLGGTITRFTPALNGTLYLTLTGSISSFIGVNGVDILTAPEVNEPRNLRSWHVNVNGVEKQGLILEWMDGKLRLSDRAGFILFVR